MKAPHLILLSVLLVARAGGESAPPQQFDQVTSREFLKQLLQDGVYYFISSKVAESLTIRRVEPVLAHSDIVPRVSGTVVVAFEITKDGKVRHAMTVSGPKLLQASVLAAIRQWRFKPYMLRDEPITVATSISFTLSNF
ncbi:MAG TPA: TonB family protein [Acidobacteriaceae bacterium]|jgi:TonB family protein|nr:TonB family protein [Acidobacteriaceae bacterium]